MTNYSGGTTKIVLTANVPDGLAEAAELNSGADRQSGAQHKVRHENALELVNAGVARFADSAPAAAVRVRQVSAATAVLELADASKTVESTGATATALTVPTHATVPLPVDTRIPLRQYGAGALSVVGASGVQVRSRGGGLRVAGQYGVAYLWKRTESEWVLSGDIAV